MLYWLLQFISVWIRKSAGTMDETEVFLKTLKTVLEISS